MASLAVIIDASTHLEHLPVSVTAWAQVKHALGCEIIITCSCDGAIVEPEGLKLVKCEGSTGARRNAAAKTTNADFLLFVKPNAGAEATAVTAICETLARDLSIAAVAPKIVHRDGAHAPSEFIFIEDQCKRRPIDVLTKPTKIERQEQWQMPPIEGVAFRSDALLVRKSAFWGVGGWDEVLESDLLDLTLGLNLKEQNWRVVFEAASTFVSFAKLEDEPNLSVEQFQTLVHKWYGRFYPQALRNSDGVIRLHPWWLKDDRSDPFGLQKVKNVFEPLPLYEELSSIPGERCSVIVVTYNSMESIEECVTTVLTHLGTFDELVLVDNASKDATPAYLQSLEGTDPRVKVVLNSENLGFSEGCNVGIRASEGDYIVLLNPDTAVPEGWLGRMRAYFEDSSVGAVGPISNGVFGLQQYVYHLPRNAKNNPTPDELNAIAIQTNARRGLESKLLIGFCLMMRRSVLDELGLLDKELFLGYDDLDISWRLRLRGLKLIVATDVLVLHKVHVSFRTEKPDLIVAYQERSANVLARKLVAHYGAGKVPSQQEIWGIDWFRPDEHVWEAVA